MDEAAWQCVGRGRGAKTGLRESIQVGAEVPRGNLWAGMAVPEVLQSLNLNGTEHLNHILLVLPLLDCTEHSGLSDLFGQSLAGLFCVWHL